MRFFRSTGMMFVLVALLVGYTFWEYRKAAKSEGLDEQESKLFSLRSEDIHEISVRQKDSDLLLKKINGEWQMFKPVMDEAEGSAVEAYLYSALIQKGKIFRSPDDTAPIKWSEYGLEPEGATVALKSEKLTEILQVSSTNAFDGSFYVRKDNELLLGDRGLAQVVGRAPNSLRQRRLWRDPEVTVEGADVRLNFDDIKGSFKIIPVGSKWTLDPKPPFVVDEDKVANWLVQVERLTPSEVVSDTPTPSEKSASLLSKPGQVVVLHYRKHDGSKGDWTLTMGQDRAGDVFMYSTSRPTIYKTPIASLNNIRVTSEFFRDGHQAFHLNAERARTIETFHDGKAYKFSKEGGDWKLVDSHATKSEVQTDRLVGLVQQLTQLEAQDFLPMKTATGFTPENTITIRDDKDQVLLALSWGDTFKSKRVYNRGADFRFVKTNLEEEAMAVNATSLNALVSTMRSIVTKSSSPPKPPVAKAVGK